MNQLLTRSLKQPGNAENHAKALFGEQSSRSYVYQQLDGRSSLRARAGGQSLDCIT